MHAASRSRSPVIADVIIVTVLVVAAAASSARAAGPAIGPLEGPKIRGVVSDVRDRLRDVTKAAGDFRLERARLQSEYDAARDAAEACKRTHSASPSRCRVVEMERMIAEEVLRDAIVASLMRYEGQIDPLTDALNKRIDIALSDPATYMSLTRAAVSGNGQSANVLLKTRDALQSLRGRLSEALIRVMLSQIATGLADVEEELQALEALTPELDSVLDAVSAPSAADPLTKHAWR